MPSIVRNLKSSIRGTTSTPDNVTSYDRLTRQVRTLLLVGIGFLAISFAWHVASEGFNLIEWIRDTFGSIGLDIIVVAVVAYLVAKAIEG
jgi:hypothetical protein